MEIVMHLVDFILHVDKYLGAFVAQYGVWVYALLFIIVFAIMQGFRSYYWRHLEAMYRQLKSTQIDD